MQFIYSIIILLLFLLALIIIAFLFIYIYDNHKKKFKYNEINVLNLVERLYIINDISNGKVYITIIDIDEELEDIKYLYISLNEIKSDLKKAVNKIKNSKETFASIEVFKDNKYFGNIELYKYNKYDYLEYVLSLNYLDRWDNSGIEFLNRKVFLSSEQFDLFYKIINNL